MKYEFMKRQQVYSRLSSPSWWLVTSHSASRSFLVLLVLVRVLHSALAFHLVQLPEQPDGDPGRNSSLHRPRHTDRRPLSSADPRRESRVSGRPEISRSLVCTRFLLASRSIPQKLLPGFRSWSAFNPVIFSPNLYPKN